MAKYRPKVDLVEGWQVPAEKDKRVKLPEFIRDWFPGRVPEEAALILFAPGYSLEGTPPMTGDFLIARGKSVSKMAATTVAEKFEAVPE